MREKPPFCGFSQQKPRDLNLSGEIEDFLDFAIHTELMYRQKRMRFCDTKIPVEF